MWCMCVCIHGVFVYTCMHVCICVYTCMYSYVRNIHVCVCVYTYMYVHLFRFVMQVHHFQRYWSNGKVKGFEVYIVELMENIDVCVERNVHKRTRAEIEKAC